VASSLTLRDALRVFWPHVAFLAAFAAMVGSAAVGAPRFLMLTLAVVASGVFPLAVYLHLRETRSRRAALGSMAGSLVRGTLLVCLALCVVVTVLFVAGGVYDGVYHDEDIVLLAVGWGVLALIWLASRYVPAFMRRRVGSDA
jgi:K+-transporting ATPase A subunit